MKDQGFSVCIQCGRTRILLKRWKDHGEFDKGTMIAHEETICPDKDCQKSLDEKFQEMRDRRAKTEERKRAVILERSLAKAAVTAISASKKPIVV